MVAGRVVLDPGSFISDLIGAPNRGVVSYTRMHHWSNKLDVLIMATESGWHAEDFKAPPEGLRQEGVPKGAPAKLAAASRRPLTKKAKLCLAGALAVVLALIAGVVSVRAINSERTGRTPEAAIREYVQLISDGKYDAASKLVDPGVTDDQRRLLTDKAYSGVKGAVKINSIFMKSSYETSAEAYVNLQVNDKTADQVLDLEKGGAGHPADEWRILTPLVTHLIITPGSGFFGSYKIGSAVVNSNLANNGLFDYLVYPGVYTIEVQSASPQYFTSALSSKQFTVACKDSNYLNDSSTVVGANVEATEKLKNWALTKFHEKAKVCASFSNQSDDACPFEVRRRDLDKIEVKSLPGKLDSISPYESRNVFYGHSETYDWSTIFVVKATVVYKIKPTDRYYESGSDVSEAGITKDVEGKLTAYISFDASGQPIIEWIRYGID